MCKDINCSHSIRIYLYSFGSKCKMGTVNTNSSLNVRAEPTDTAPIIGQLPAGEKVDFIDAGQGWAKITYNGYLGYVSSSYLKTSETNKKNV